MYGTNRTQQSRQSDVAADYEESSRNPNRAAQKSETFIEVDGSHLARRCYFCDSLGPCGACGVVIYTQRWQAEENLERRGCR
jgi:hypothetical protein